MWQEVGRMSLADRERIIDLLLPDQALVREDGEWVIVNMYGDFKPDMQPRRCRKCLRVQLVCMRDAWPCGCKEVITA